MSEIDSLRERVSQTLRRAKDRTGVEVPSPTSRRRRRRADPKTDTLAETDHGQAPMRIGRALQHQRQICSRLKQEIALARADRQNLLEVLSDLQERCETLERNMEIMDWRIEHTQGQQRELIREGEVLEAQLDDARQMRREVTGEVMEVYDAAQRIAARLKRRRVG